jgi:hypothetical protein
MVGNEMQLFSAPQTDISILIAMSLELRTSEAVLGYKLPKP